MLVSFSFYDVLRIPEIAAIAETQFDLLPHHMDSIVAPYLFRLGGDIDRGLKIQACRHRMINLQSVVGFRYVMLERSDKEWLKDRNCSMSARIHSQEDPYLASDMVRMSMEGTSEGKFIAMCAACIGKDGTVGVVKKEESEDWQEDVSMMRTLMEIQRSVRTYIHPDENMFDDEPAPNEANFETQTKSDY